MSIKWISRGALILSAVSLLVLLVARTFLGGWIPFLWWPLGAFFVSLFVGLILDFRTYWSLFTLKTAKDGLGVGFTLLILISILSSLAYLTKRFDKTFDLTEEKLHSLSEQTLSILNSMEEIKMTVFYKGAQSLSTKNELERYLRIYKQNASHIQFEYIDAHLNNKKAKSYLEPLSDKNNKDVFLFIDYQGKKVRVEEPIGESTVLSALIQVSRRVDQNIYFTSGHGERDMFAEHAQALSVFTSELEANSFNVVEWNFIEKRSGVPEDASALMILGPTKPFFEQEIKWIQEYVKRDGRVLIALDPGVNQNLAPFLKEMFGVEFKNNFIVSPISSLVGKSNTSVMGMDYNVNHLITKDFVRMMGGFTSIFDEVSQVAFEDHPQVKVDPLIYSVGGFTISSLDIAPAQEKQQSFVMAVAVEEETKKDAESGEGKEKEKKENEDDEQEQKNRFIAVIFGDSNFLTNGSFNVGIHKDIALNTISYLADRENLLNIRPKQPKGTHMVLTQTHKLILIIAAILLPLICFICAVFVWVRRKWS
ncbi:MAG: GldG family protein [Bdellovibrionales bacterium]|nr:GldG family protein [Bdellovibrionales bacterium]